MADFYKLIHDEDMVRRFYKECLPKLDAAQVYFLSLSARNKYLTDEERRELELGRTEMFAKTIIRHSGADEFVKHIRRLECDTRGYTTRTGAPVPEKCLVCYVNLDPSSTVTALMEFQKVLNEYTIEALSLAFNKGNAENFANRFNKIDNNLLTCYQQAKTKGPWIDLDVDLINKNPNREEADFFSIVSTISGYGISDYRFISTRSGYHVLIARKQLTCDPSLIATAVMQSLVLCGVTVSEVVVNKNRMVPVPGTYQAGTPVKLLTVEDFV